jgi:LysM repeat protein
VTPKRFGIFIALNVVLSLLVTLAVLWIWQSTVGPVVTPAGPAAPAATASAAVTAPALPTPVPTKASGPVNYTVQAGDTLSSIADRYDVSLEDLMAANGLTNPNVLSVGQELIIPIGGLPTPTTAPTAVPTPLVPIATATASAGGVPVLKITLVNTPGVLDTEGVVIANDGSAVVRLEGWTLIDGQGNAYTFPLFQLFPGGAVTVHTRTGENGASDLYWNRTAPVWKSGGTATIKNPAGAAQVSFRVP